MCANTVNEIFSEVGMNDVYQFGRPFTEGSKHPIAELRELMARKQEWRAFVQEDLARHIRATTELRTKRSGVHIWEEGRSEGKDEPRKIIMPDDQSMAALVFVFRELLPPDPADKAERVQLLKQDIERYWKWRRATSPGEFEDDSDTTAPDVHAGGASQITEDLGVPISKEAREIFGPFLEEFGHDVAALIEGKEGLTAFFGALAVEAKVYRGADQDSIERFKRGLRAAIEEWVRRKRADDGQPSSPDRGGENPE